MARTKILVKRNINSLTKKIPYGKMPIGIKIVGIYKQVLFIIY